jgi:hypothetical protein
MKMREPSPLDAFDEFDDESVTDATDFDGGSRRRESPPLDAFDGGSRRRESPPLNAFDDETATDRGGVTEEGCRRRGCF